MAHQTSNNTDISGVYLETCSRWQIVFFKRRQVLDCGQASIEAALHVAISV